MKLLVPALFAAAAIGAIVWVLAPSEPTAGRPTAAKTAPSVATAPEVPADPARPAMAPRPVTPASGKGATALQAARAAVTAPAIHPVALGDPRLAAVPVEDRPVVEPRWGRDGQGPLTADPVAVTNSVRAYYRNLPKSGQIPAKIRVDEILPASLVAQMNLPINGQVLELGPYPISDPQAFTTFLDSPPGTIGALGITVLAPDGERVREYLSFPQ